MKTPRDFGLNYDEWMYKKSIDGWIIYNISISENPPQESTEISTGVLEFWWVPAGLSNKTTHVIKHNHSEEVTVTIGEDPFKWSKAPKVRNW